MDSPLVGATTLGIMAHDITTLNVMGVSIMALFITTLRIIVKNALLSVIMLSVVE
jgi:hypothetical protein